MIFLDYNLDPAMIKKVTDYDIISATNDTLDYYLFCGDIYFRVNGANFDALWSWIPLIDFSMKLAEISCTIRDGETAIFEFTESDDKIYFLRTKEVIDVTCDYSNAHAQTSLSEMRAATVSFAKKVFNDLTNRWPLLKSSKAFQEKMDEFGRYSEQCR